LAFSGRVAFPGSDWEEKSPESQNIFHLCVLGILIGLFSGSGACMASEPVYPGTVWRTAPPADMGMDIEALKRARDYALTGGGSGMVIQSGTKVFEWGDQDKTYDLKSSTKSIGVTALGLALLDGKVQLDDLAMTHHPTFGAPPESNRGTGWLGQVTLHQLANQTAGFDKRGGYEPLLFKPGTQWNYSDGGPNWLAECLTLTYGMDIEKLLFDRLFTRMGITSKDLRWRNNQYREHLIEGMKRCEFGAGVHANVDAMARIGLLYLRHGQWQGEQLLPVTFIDAARRVDPLAQGLPVLLPKEYGQASNHYGLLWWNNNDGALENVPRDTYWSWGLYESLIIVMPSLDLVAARAGKSWRRDLGKDHYAVLAPLMDNLVQAAQGSARISDASYPASSVITGVQWADSTEVMRMAPGGDNWPMTWADDEVQYSAYGDGWGFKPLIDTKLSLGIACVRGTPPDIQGENIRTPTGEQIGPGVQGKKASGILMVDGVLYLLTRNADNSQLAWSSDQGRTWTWSNWRFKTSFGCPTFLNFGKNYSGARDGYVYVYSHDNDSAYERADCMVLARVEKDQIRDRTAYEFFTGLDKASHPIWSPNVEDRGAVFEHHDRCYRSSITYNAGLGRYLWCQVLGGSDPEIKGNDRNDTRFKGGFGIYDAPEPWGPWTTAYFTKQWDMGPGETCSLPTAWMSDDGKTCWLVFSGDDCFSIRKVRFVVP